MNYNTKNRRLWFKDMMRMHKRIAIAGGPKVGKTTLARLAKGKRTVINGDDFMHLNNNASDWSAQSEKIAASVNGNDGPLIVEGVAVPRALRKGMKVDAVLWIGCRCYADKCTCGNEPIVEEKKGHISMRKGALKVFAEWRASNPDVPVYQAPPPVPFVGDEPEGDFDE